MGKNKLARFAENETFSTLIQVPFSEVFSSDHALKGHWQDRFGVSRPLTLELGCGRGEYTLSLSALHPDRNFVGIDIKGARIWYGAKRSHMEGLPNVLFLRTRIELLGSFFSPGEVDQIWITFPDPQLKERREKKRLTGPAFLEMYHRILRPGGVVHLKTDSQELYAYTLQQAQAFGASIQCAFEDIDPHIGEYPDLGIVTRYEEKFRTAGKRITYLRLALGAEG